ncbi:MAG: helix-turn-helix transcriptional regulator [Thermoplasmata archaeon]|nr:helix-turn-helix transcriptional regulator [Thermoplasmata archaeon]
MVSLEFLLGVAAGLGLSGVTLLGFWWYQRRLRARLRTSDPVPLVMASPPPPNVSADGTELKVPATEVARPASPNESEPIENTPPAREPQRASLRDPPPVAEATVQLSHRVLLHLYRQGFIRPDEVPPRSLSQSGMIEALQIRQGALAGVLLRLEAAGVVASETTHVRGGTRRVKVYRLTDRGTQLAKELRGSSARRTQTPKDR